jgi:hypothetical protein
VGIYSKGYDFTPARLTATSGFGTAGSVPYALSTLTAAELANINMVCGTSLAAVARQGCGANSASDSGDDGGECSDDGDDGEAGQQSGSDNTCTYGEDYDCTCDPGESICGEPTCETDDDCIAEGVTCDLSTNTCGGSSSTEGSSSSSSGSSSGGGDDDSGTDDSG